MYDGCGHEHCTRLSRHLPMAAKDGHSEVALWLWEVHNAGEMFFFNRHKDTLLTKDETNLTYFLFEMM